MPKPGHIGRYRPIAALGIVARVVLRALTSELAGDVPAFDRSFAAQQAFQHQPVEARSRYVVVADVASFYFFVEHRLLAARLIDLTARADTAEATRVLLDGLIGRPYGLPQNFGPSRPLSEAFIAPVERRMQRAGVMTFRSNDDFRLCADGWGDALQALERLQEEVSAVGLDLNGEKSWILKLDTYTRNMALTDELLAAALASADDEDLPDIDAYTGEPVEHDEDEDEDEVDAGLADVAVRIFEHAATERLGDRRMDGFQRTATRQALVIGLHLLSRSRSEAGVADGAKMVAIDPLLARPYVGYLRALDAEGPVTAQRVQHTLALFRGHAPYWTQAWLANALLDPRVTLTDDTVAFLERLLGSPAPAVLRMRAALVLAFHGRFGAAEVAAMIDGVPPSARPDAVAAMALASASGGRAQALRAYPDDRLLRWVADFAFEHRKDPGPLL
ncbi:MAG: reverse transcriptase domain-containing protein [Chloroflexota bacterium]|nr:reverse transcriptase domain-containing protein [Chloroflexota bacterium]